MKLKYIVPVALLFVGAGCQQAVPVIEKQLVAQVIVYKDPKYGFSVTLPAEWKNYSVKYRQIDWGTFKNDSLDIGLPGDESLLNIEVMTKAQWTKLQTDPQIPEKGMLLGEQSGTIFVGESAQSVQPENDARFAEVLGILKSFSLK